MKMVRTLASLAPSVLLVLSIASRKAVGQSATPGSSITAGASIADSSHFRAESFEKAERDFSGTVMPVEHRYFQNIIVKTGFDDIG